MGTGRGKFAGRGAKGAKSISGYSKMRGFEGGQMPLHRRLPKRGFTNIFHKEYAIINVGVLEKFDGDTFTPESLQKLRLGEEDGCWSQGSWQRRIDPQDHHHRCIFIRKRQWTRFRSTAAARK